MADRRDVHPHHVLRAVLDEPDVVAVLAELGVRAVDVRLTLDERWLAAADTIEVEEVEARGIDVPTLLAAVNPPFDAAPEWGGRQITDATRAVLVRSLGLRGPAPGRPLAAGHLLLGLMASRDRIVSGTFRAHGLRLRVALPVVERHGRRAP